MRKIIQSDALSSVLTIIFGLAWLVAACSWFYGIYETIATFRMMVNPYNVGKKVIDFTEAFNCNMDSIKVNTVIETENGKFKFISENVCLFRNKIKLFTFRFHTPFPLKGRLELQDGAVHIKGRLPLAPTIFFVAWLIGWTSGGIGFAAQQKDFGSSAVFVLMGWLFLALIYYIFIPLEKKRLLLIYEEIKFYLEGKDPVRNA